MIWIYFTLLILTLLAIDLGVLHKKGQELNHRKAAIETTFWVSIALLFSLAVLWLYKSGYVDNSKNLRPSDALVKYITGYLIELSLSVDNLFVIAFIFTSFKIPTKFQHWVLFWGILGAIVFRASLIGVGVILINKISWMTYVFGLFLLFTAFRMLSHSDDDEDEGQSKMSNRIRRWLKVSKNLNGNKFWTRENGKKLATPLLAALVMIEITDVMFALDSIPAILAVTTDPFIVYSSNMFAILGLRSLYFFLAHMLRKFHYLKYSVFAILVFVSIKLLASHHMEFPEWFSLTFIGVSLIMGIIVSLQKRKQKVARWREAKKAERRKRSTRE
ncbi:MAG: TerC/Alx family metal homeostasis membrane protein [Saprospiraceae bacterium]|nr:TerC/Alx family metal homeostasis membrane protein [Saprospiraceae bacterium]